MRSAAAALNAAISSTKRLKIIVLSREGAGQTVVILIREGGSCNS